MLFSKSKVNQQKKYERKTYEHKIEELRKKLEDLQQAIEMLKTHNC